MIIIIPERLEAQFLDWAIAQGYCLTHRPDAIDPTAQTNANVVKFPRRHHQYIGAALPTLPGKPA